MSREKLTKAITDATMSYLESIARLIAENPTIRLADLRRFHGITQHDMWRAQSIFHIHRTRGKGSSAHKKRIKP
jgi:hypothetical protein